MLDMQVRVRQKEANRKEVEAVIIANKKRCDREERRAKVQLQAYWEMFPLPTDVSQTENTQAPDSEDDELIEALSQGATMQNRMSTMRNSEQELVEENNCGDHLYIEATSPLSYVPRKKCPRTASSGARQEYLNILHTCIAEKQKPMPRG